MKNKKYDFILVEHSMKVYNSIKNHENMIYHLHNDIIGDKSRSESVTRNIIETSYCTLGVSQFVVDRLNSVKLSSKNRVLYNCIDFDVFNPENVNHEFIKNFRKENNINDDDFCFAFSGRIQPEKGCLQLIEAFKELRKIHNNIKLLIIGKPDFGKEEKTTYVKKLEEVSNEIRNDIIFTGFVNHNDMPTVLSIADCAVIPSMYEEAFGVIALEVMAMKKAVIATISGGLTEPLDDECAIFVNKQENVTQNLYKAMEQIIKDKDLAPKMGEAGFKRVHSIYDFDSKNYFDNFCKKIELEKLKS